MDDAYRAQLRSNLALIAPGTALRDGLDRIVHGRTGALIVLGHTPAVAAISTGGFAIDVALSATALRELAKMDGAILVTGDLSRIVHAGVHLMPDAQVPTDETGTRHRTADRVSRLTGVPVITVSASMSSIALFIDGQRYVVQRPEHLLTRANQALATLSRYRDRLAEAAARLTGLEIQDTVTVRDVAQVAQRAEMVRRLQSEIDEYVVELGVDGRLVELQVQELVAGLGALTAALERDYSSDENPVSMAALARTDPDELLDPARVAQRIGLSPDGSLDGRLHARGHRQLAQIGRLPSLTAERLVQRFGTLQGLFGASTSDLREVPGVDHATARAIREGLARLTEASFHDRPGLPTS